MLQHVKEQHHRKSIHENGQESESEPSAPIKRGQLRELKGLDPKQQRQAGGGGSQITEDEDLYLLEPLKKSFAIDVVKGRAQATGQDEQVARQITGLQKRALLEILDR